jgi:hypothetical protein
MRSLRCIEFRCGAAAKVLRASRGNRFRTINRNAAGLGILAPR